MSLSVFRSTVLVLGLATATPGLCDGAGAGAGAAQAAPTAAAQARFNALDADHDGLLSRYEYDTDVVFETADSDHDGLLTEQELQIALGPQMPGTPSVAKRMIVADIDNDGGLEDGELREAMEKRFAWLDRNHDGNLDLVEMTAGYGVRVRP
ncbi:MAG TPA: hypothetical protein VGC74_13255 [Stenotrophomonas sp.]